MQSNYVFQKLVKIDFLAPSCPPPPRQTLGQGLNRKSRSVPLPHWALSGIPIAWGGGVLVPTEGEANPP